MFPSSSPALRLLLHALHTRLLQHALAQMKSFMSKNKRESFWIYCQSTSVFYAIIFSFIYFWLYARSLGSPVYALHFQCGKCFAHLCKVSNIYNIIYICNIYIYVYYWNNHWSHWKKSLDDTTGWIIRLDVFLGCVGAVCKHPSNHPRAFSFDQRETLFLVWHNIHYFKQKVSYMDSDQKVLWFRELSFVSHCCWHVAYASRVRQ